VKRHHLTPLRTLILSVWLGLAGCKTPQATAPSMAPLPAEAFVKQWQADVGNARDPITQLHVREGALIAYTHNNNSFWLSASGGQLLAINQVAAPGHTIQPPVSLADRVVIPTTATVEIFDKSGKHIDSLKSPRVLESPAAGAGESFFIAVAYPGSGRLAKVDLGKDKASLDWELYTSAGIVAAPAVVGDSVFCAGMDGKVTAVTFTRQPLWPLPDNVFRTGGPVTADVAADDSGVYVASQDSKLYCLDRAIGKIHWIYYAGTPLTDQPLILGNMILQLVPYEGLVAINKTEGAYSRQPMWRQPVAEQVLAADDKFLYVRNGSTIIALDKASGEPRFRSDRADLSVFATNLTTPMIYAATHSGTILGIRPVLKPGTVGEMVFNEQVIAEPVAMAK
jgi:hypothetical protein